MMFVVRFLSASSCTQTGLDYKQRDTPRHTGARAFVILKSGTFANQPALENLAMFDGSNKIHRSFIVPLVGEMFMNIFLIYTITRSHLCVALNDCIAYSSTSEQGWRTFHWRVYRVCKQHVDAQLRIRFVHKVNDKTTRVVRGTVLTTFE